MIDEMLKTFKALNEFTMTLLDPNTYFRDVKPEEFQKFLIDFANGVAQIYRLSFETSLRIMAELPKGDPEVMLNIYLNYISQMEDIFAEMSDNDVIAAYINALNKAYLRYLMLIQNLNNAALHSLGLASRKDIIALAEAYVDLKGDIKRESRRLLKEIRKMRDEMKVRE